MKFGEWNCELVYGHYYGGNTAIQIIDSDDGCPIATATVNIDGLKDGEVAIKDYSENEGMLEFLLKENIVEKPHRFERSGFVVLPVCKLIEHLRV